MNNYEQYVGLIIESHYGHYDDQGQLAVKVVSFDSETKSCTLEIVSTTPWRSSLGLKQGLAFCNVYRKASTINIANQKVTLPEFWIPEGGGLPWMNLCFDPKPSFEHYR